VTVVLVGVALIVGFTLGAPIGFFAYHFGRLGVNKYLPIHQAKDHEKKRNAAVMAAAQLAEEERAIKQAYFGGLQLDRDSYIAGEKKL
jgi:hypothetical protein